jgi:hypothetical protein
MRTQNSTVPLELKIQSIFDWLFSTISDLEALRLEIGVWDASELPYSFYAVLKDNKSNVALLGESSYGSETIEDAIDAILSELSQESAKEKVRS